MLGLVNFIINLFINVFHVIRRYRNICTKPHIMGILLFRLCFAQARIIRSTRVNSMLPWAPSEVNKKAVHEIVILLSHSNVVLRRADALWRDSLRFLWCYAPIKSCGLARLMAYQAGVYSPKKTEAGLKTLQTHHPPNDSVRE